MSDQPEPAKSNDEELDRWVAEQLRERGLDPQSLTLEQMVALMQEAVETIIAKLQDASQEAGDLAIGQELQVLAEQAQELHTDLEKLHREVDAGPTSQVPRASPPAPSPDQGG